MAAVASQPSGSASSSSNAVASTSALPPTASTTRARYAKLAKVGEGTYASVFLARDLATNEKLAIKKIKIVSSADGLDMTALREVQFLRELRHPNVIRLVDVFSSGSATPSLNLVLEFLDTNLEALIKDRSILFRPEDIKSWMAMLCRGLEYTHRNGCLHRDLKPNNLLIAPSGELKIADFGLARGAGEPGQKMSNQVVTRWYRSPELLLGARHYGYGVDMWAVGCIFAELHLRLPYLPGESDLEQLTVVFRALGTPTEKEWLKHKSLPHYMNFEQHPKQDLSQLFSAASPDTLDMLAKLLLYDPMRRLSAHGCLHHAYFRTAPSPTPFADLPRHAAAVPAGHVLLSDSETKDSRRRAGAVSGGLAGEGEAAEEKTRPKKRALDEKERDEQRRRIARKLAFE